MKKPRGCKNCINEQCAKAFIQAEAEAIFNGILNKADECNDSRFSLLRNEMESYADGIRYAVKEIRRGLQERIK